MLSVLYTKRPSPQITSMYYYFFFTEKGRGVHIYVIDSGVSSTHNEFRGRFSNQGYDEFKEGVGKVRWIKCTASLNKHSALRNR